MTRPIILNGITQIADQPDLIDRSIFINVPNILAEHRKTEKEIWRSFDILRRRILGRLCDALVVILKAEDKDFVYLPRMADFAKFVSKAEKELLWDEGALISALNANRTEALDQLNECDMLLNEIMMFAKEKKDYAFISLGTQAELYERLVCAIPYKSLKVGFPDSIASMSKRLNGLKPVLREKGIIISDKKSSGKRIKLIEWKDK